ncbi:MAG: VOC family protein [Hyphomonadaceae bacterium]
MAQQAITSGVHHVGLTVPDVDETCGFFVDVLGFEKLGSRPDYPVTFVKDGGVVLSLWRVQDEDALIPFERKNTVGLHHLALIVDGEDKLEIAYNRLCTSAGVDIEFAPEWLGSGPSRHMMCLIPGGIRLELIAPSQS